MPCQYSVKIKLKYVNDLNICKLITKDLKICNLIYNIFKLRYCNPSCTQLTFNKYIITKSQLTLVDHAFSSIHKTTI